MPFSRLYGTFYCGGDSKNLPKTLYHPIYFKQHIKPPFRFYQEADSYPHIRYFTSAAQIRAMMAIAYSYGFDGSVFQTQQMLDAANEEPAYGRMFVRARAKLEELHRVAKQCRQVGVEICYDPFWNTVADGHRQTEPLWAKSVGLFGIPYITTESAVAFWDVRQAKHAEDETVMHYLSKGLFLDGEAAQHLCERGFGEWIGVSVGEDVATGMYRFDLGASNVIREPFASPTHGRRMPPAHAYAVGREGKLFRLTPTHPSCEIISEEFDFEGNPVSVSMTRFENSLGGRVTVLGEVLNGNESQSLYNYRRQRLFQRLVADCGDLYAFVEEAPGTFVVMNEAIDREADGFLGMLTLVNLCDDPVEAFSLHLPTAWREPKALWMLDSNGEWQPLPHTRVGDSVSITQPLHYCEPFCILVC